MKVTTDRQTLILAGESLPRRRGARYDSDADAVDESPQRVTIISARFDAIVAEGRYVADSRASTLPTVEPHVPVEQAYVVINRASSSVGAGAYACTQNLADDKISLIDTYA